MLLRFQVSNHRSILDPVELSLIAVDEDRPATRSFELLSQQVLTVAGVYGPNASGKSNLLDAIAWLSSAVATSLRGWDDFIPRDPHRFGKGPTTPSLFGLDIVVDGVRYEYQLEVEDSAVRYESLHSYPERRRRTLFERHDTDIRFRRGLKETGGTQELLTPSTLALSAAIRFKNPQMWRVGRAIAGMRSLGLRRPWHRRLSLHDPSSSSLRLFTDEHGVRQEQLFGTAAGHARPLDLLRFADPGIDDVRLTETDDEGGPGPRRRLRFVHRVDDEPVAFELEQESAGTQTWFRLIGPALGALRDGRVLLFDEIDASLHPRLSARLLELFQDPQTNPRGAQLIFTTHDTSLLNVMNRDEVWLTEKEPDGTSRLVGLAEFGGERVRKSLNLERAYLQGRFGAVPEVDQIAVREALGIASAAL
ncbi:AAA family ATPase [Candidatus Poriferisodalis sp.]|uniref:AAA family ATPase n=1 Tax=Candidatus Poriferisodalis sp. TaxID=3101277 RepID=UPI003C6F4DB4